MRKTLTTLAIVVAVLLAFGLAVLASASAVRGQGLYGDPHYFVNRQVVWLLLSGCVVYAAMRFDYHWWKETPKLTILVYAAVVVALLLVFCPGTTAGKINGSWRWIKLGPFRIQPSEFAKILIVIAMSVWLDRVGWRVRQFWKGAFWPSCGMGLIALLLVLEPDFGATMVVCLTGGMLMFVAGTRVIKHLAPLAVIGGMGVLAALVTNENRMARLATYIPSSILEWLPAWVTARLPASGGESAAAYQVTQALLAFKNGGPWGVGFNQSIQKYNYLPEAHTDFIFAIGGEEFGFLFSAGMLVAYAVILICGLRISLRAPDRLGRLLAFGMTFLLVFQAVFNIAVVTDSFVTKGLALPFISYGGTHLITAMLAVGTLLNVGRHVDVFDERLHTQVVKNADIKL